jgi:hypothetical protein
VIVNSEQFNEQMRQFIDAQFGKVVGEIAVTESRAAAGQSVIIHNINVFILPKDWGKSPSSSEKAA